MGVLPVRTQPVGEVAEVGAEAGDVVGHVGRRTGEADGVVEVTAALAVRAEDPPRREQTQRVHQVGASLHARLVGVGVGVPLVVDRQHGVAVMVHRAVDDVARLEDQSELHVAVGSEVAGLDGHGDEAESSVGAEDVRLLGLGAAAAGCLHVEGDDEEVVSLALAVPSREAVPLGTEVALTDKPDRRVVDQREVAHAEDRRLDRAGEVRHAEPGFPALECSLSGLPSLLAEDPRVEGVRAGGEDVGGKVAGVLRLEVTVLEPRVQTLGRREEGCGCGHCVVSLSW